MQANGPLLLLVLGFSAGIAVGDWVGIASLSALAACGVLCLVFAVGVFIAHIVSSRYDNNRLFAFLFILSIVVATASIGCLRYYIAVEDYSSEWPGEKKEYLCTLTTLPKESAKTWSVDAELKDAERGERLVRLRLMKKDSLRLKVGDVILVSGKVQAPHNSGNPGSPDFALMQRRQGVEGVLFCPANHWKPTGRTSESLLLRMQRMRSELVDTYKAYFEGRELAVLSALTLGDKTMLTPEVREVFSETGTSHVLALSGLHLGILFGLYIFLIVSRFPTFSRSYYVASVFGIVLVWLFVFFVGMPVSLVRAAVMYTIVQGMGFFEWSVVPIGRLAYAAIAILFFSPQALFDVGFQLSFLSVLGIILFQPLFPEVPRFGRNVWMRTLRRVCTFLSDMLMVGMSAMLFTLPLVAYYFNVVPIYGLLGSIIVVCLAYPLLFLGLLFFILPFGKSLLAAVLNALLGCMMSVLDWLSELPFASFRCYPSLLTVVLVYLLILTVYSYLAQDRTWKLVLSSVLLACIIGIEVYESRREEIHPEIVVYQNFSMPIVHCIESPSESYLWTTRPERLDSTMSFVRRTFWKKADLQEPYVLQGDTATRALHFSTHVLQFHGKRMALLYAPLHASSRNPLHVDYLLLVRGWNRDLAEALQVFRPDTLLLDASLSEFYRSRFCRQADSLHIPLHDIYADGAKVIVP